MRRYHLFNQNWGFIRLEHAADRIPTVPEGTWETVTIPHVWNQSDALQCGCCVYRTSFHVDKKQENSYFLEFEAVAGVCRVFVNGTFLGEHRGGYSCFRFQADLALKDGENLLEVIADNTRYDDINPLTGDFNNYGGIYRNVSLIETKACHFDLLYHGTCGMELDAEGDGGVRLKARTVGTDSRAVIRYIITGGDTSLVEEVPADENVIKLAVEHPHLWNGICDPFCYHCRAELWSEGQMCDAIELTFGFRAIELNPQKGFFLNGIHLNINGVAKHQDWQGMGNAPTCRQLDEDMELILDLGANAVRLSHYQHPQYTYDLCDRQGLVVWAEIPLLSLPDGNEGIARNAEQQLTELILQNKHHPSICFWGLQNEIAIFGESLDMYANIEQLHALVKRLDSNRLSAAANLYCVKNNSQLNFITDMVGYNSYYGWYYGEMADYTGFLQQFHRENPDVALGISEYGVDCSLTLHSDSPKCKDYSEEFQALYHETVYPQLEADEALWGTFVWNMFDFGSANRNEGGHRGVNRKGLVTWDRKTKKDSYYYYQASWSEKPVLYMTGKRFRRRTGDFTQVKVYSNCNQVTLWVNNSVFASLEGNRVFVFEQVPLGQGQTLIRAEAEGMEDQMVLQRVCEPELSYIYVDPNPAINVKNWFTLEAGKDDLFPQSRFSLMDSVGEIFDSPEAYEVLKGIFPQITEDENVKSRRGDTLLRFINRKSRDFEEGEVKKLNAELNKIAKNA